MDTSGFVFGSLKSREWWSSDLMPVIFLFSAIISGTALVIVLYVLIVQAAQSPNRSIVSEGHGICAMGLHDVHAGHWKVWNSLSLVYRGREGIEVIMEFVKGPLVVPFFILQFGVGSVLPLAVITFLIWRGSSGTR